MGKTRKFDSRYVVWTILAVFFIVFAIISWWSPVAGDDWAYAVNSVDHHPLLLALQRYYTWSGRFFSELWGYIIPRNKWLWDWLNPALFTAIFWWLMKDAGVHRHPVSSALLTFALMFTVTDYLRMQTYTWMMGTTYVVPLLLFLIYAWLLKDFILEGKEDRRAWIAMCVLNFTIPLWMENMAAMITGGNLLVLIYLWFKDRSKLKKMLILTALSGIATIIIRMSPGAASRLALDHPEFIRLSLMEKIRTNWISLIRLTYTDNLWLTRALSVLLIAVVLQKRRQVTHAKWQIWLLVLIFCWGLVQTYSYQLFQWTNLQFFANLSDVTWSGFKKVNTLGYGLWTLAALYVLFAFLPAKRKWSAAYFFFCAGGANIVMLLSPIFDARSSLYTVYLLILICVLLYEELVFSPAVHAAAAALLCGCCAIRISSYLQLYYQVSRVTWARQQYIAWYLGDRTVKEGVMPAYPELSVHSANISAADEFHMYYFLRYYDLDPNLKLTFEEVDLDTVGK